MKKFVLFLLATLCTLALASGCSLGGGSSTESSAPASDSTTSEITESQKEPSNDSSEETSEEDSNSSPEDSSTPDNSSEEDSSSPDDGGSTPDDPTHNELCHFSEWELTTEVSCSADGEMTRYCLESAAHVETKKIPKRPHDFGNNGLCKCGSSPTFSNLPNSGYVDPTDTIETFISEEIGSKKVHVLTVDQPYSAVTDKFGEFWFQYSVPRAGQYAVVSHKNPNGLTVERYDANAFYVNPAPLSGRIMDDGNFVSTVSVDEVHYHDQWLTVGCIKGTQSGQKVTFSIVRVEEASWKPSNIYEDIYAKQINGVKAPNGAQGTKPIEVPYDSTGIYYNQQTGWYHMSSGEVIYAAITKKAERQFGGGTIAFTDLLSVGSAQNFRIQHSTLPTGDYLIYNYAAMIMADPTLEGVSYNENSYEAQVNKDGLYPVTQELHDFLVSHAKNHQPATAPDAGHKENAWLSVCYYYKALTPGSQENPFEITQTGTFTATRYNMFKPVYYTFKPAINGTSALSAYVLSVATDGVTLNLYGQQYQNKDGNFGIQSIIFEANPALGVTFMFSTVDASLMEFEVSITPLENVTLGLGESTLQPITVLDTEGVATYQICYAYTATENGTLTLSSNNRDAVLSLDTSSLDQDYVSVEVIAGQTVIVYVKTSDGSSVDVNLTFTAA